jgi:hypothetical protein
MTSPFARARGEMLPTVELAEQVAKLLEEPYSHQLGVCGQLGLSYRTYKTWVGDDSPEHAHEFRRIVLAALERKRVADLQRGEQVLEDAHPAKAGPCFNMWKFQHESRFKRFYQDDPVKVEHTGKDGADLGLSIKEVLKLYIDSRKDAEDGE